MSIEVTLKCDALGCCNERTFVDIPTETDLENIGWHTHPVYGEDHYCAQCWPEVKKELEE